MPSHPLAPTSSSLALADSRRLRLFTLCALYFAQGVPWGFVTIALVAVLSEGGISQQQTGLLVSLAVLPWTFKFFWGPIIDSFRVPSLGLRRPWIVFAEIMMAVTLLLASSNAEIAAAASIVMLGWIFFAHNVFASLQDVATDALAIDLLDESERGKANGFMWGSKLVGMSVGGAGIGSVIARFGFNAGMQVQAVVILLIMLLPLLLRERAGEKLFPWSSGEASAPTYAVHVAASPLWVLRELLRAFSLPTTILAALVAFTALMCEGLHAPLTPEVFTQRLGWTAEHYGHMQGIWGTAGKMLGALVGGLLCDRFGRRRIAGVGMCILALTFFSFALTSSYWTASWFPRNFVLLAIETGLAWTTVSLFSLFMKISWTGAAATQFTLLMTVQNAGYALGPNFTRLGLGHEASYLLCGVLALVPLLFLPHLRPDGVVERRRAEEALVRPAPSTA